jgi:23S rRNA (cytidine1920-2'-O)/16S rRNA (cytidine1409-2'-O)-methyltransferase
MKHQKIRLDQLLVERGLFVSRTQAHAAIMAGEIFHEDNALTKAGQMVDALLEVSWRSRQQRYVSRGGVKLEGALEDFALDPSCWDGLDIGSSTGGFTDCLLARGARQVTCVDAGRGQLHQRLRSDPRVLVREQTNARYLTPADFPELFDLIVMDVSFISIVKILKPAAGLLKKPLGRILALIKPQFEVGPKYVGKGGIVRDQAAVASSIQRIIGALDAFGLAKPSIVPSRLKGTDGNQEYFLYAELKP